MIAHHHVRKAESASAEQSLYRITARGLAVAAWEQQGWRTRHIVDLLQLLQSSIPGLPEAQLRGFMPAESLTRAIAMLLEMGLIESRAAPVVARAAARPEPERRPPGPGRWH